MLAPFCSRGQQIVSQEWYYWIRYYNQATLSKKLTLHTEFDTRRYMNLSKQSQFFTHIHIHRQFKPWLDAAVGFNYNSSKPASNPDLTVPELRPWFEFSLLSTENKKWMYLFRYRQDERFIHNNDRVQLTDGYRFTMRHRFRVMTRASLATFKNGDKLQMRLYDELMVNTVNAPRSFDQNRFSVSFTYLFDKHWSLETGYINILQQRSDGEYFFRHVIRTTLYHRIDLTRNSAE